MSDQNLEKQIRKTYLKMIENSIGTRMFNSAYVKNIKSGKIIDVLNDGELSCAFFVSGLTHLMGMIDKPHSTVKTVEKILNEDNRWKKTRTDSLKLGDILVWETEIFEDGSINEHIGFYLNNRAVSTSYIEKQVVEHHPTFGVKSDGNPKRKIVCAYRFIE